MWCRGTDRIRENVQEDIHRNRIWVKPGNVLAVAGYNFRGWHKNPRIFISFALSFILCFLLSNKIVVFTQEHDLTMQLLEPFIWTFADSDSILLSSLILVFLFADMPFISGATPFFLMRTDRKTWIFGQIVYIIAATFLYLVFVLVFTLILCSQRSFPGNMWSNTAVMLGYSQAGETISIPVSVKTMETVTPFGCAAIIFLLMLCYTVLLILIMLVFNLAKGGIWSMAAVLGFSVYGFLLSPDVFKKVLRLSEAQEYKANVFVGWCSPLNQATFSMHSFGYDQLPRLSQSFAMYLILILGCLLVSRYLIRKYNFSFAGTAL